MKYQAVLFDLDGTLSDSAPGILAGVRFALEKMGREVPGEAVLRRFLGPPLVDSFIPYCGMTREEAERAQDYYREYYHQTGYLENAVYPGVRGLLKALKAQGAFLGVATHKPLAPSLKILETFDILRYFDEVAGPLDTEDRDPTKGDLILRAKPDGLSCVMVGDRASDFTGARQAGMPAIAALYGYGDEGEFDAVGAIDKAFSPEDLYGLLGVEKPAPRGYFISFEGNDGSGKSTQARFLAQRLKACGHDVLLTREPGGTPVGEKVRDILLQRENMDMEAVTEALLFAAARAQHVRQVIRPALSAGRLVISDRFVDSSIAYQGAGRGLGMEMVRAINAPAVDGCMPDTTVFLSLDPREGMKRRSRSGNIDRLEQEGDAFHQAVGEGYRAIIGEDRRFIAVTSQPNKLDTAAEVFARVAARLLEDGVP